MSEKEQEEPENEAQNEPPTVDSKPKENISSSMTSLIVWNVTKAFNNNPSLDLKSALSKTRLRLESSSYDVNSTISQHPEDRNLVCALLAWQQLGRSTSTLYTKLESIWNKLKLEKPGSSKAFDPCKHCLNNTSSNKIPLQTHIRDYISYRDSSYSNSMKSSSFTMNRMGPVVKLPVEEKVVMHLQNTSQSRPSGCGRNKDAAKIILEKIDAACCVESACQEKLAKVEAGLTELRARAVRLGKREAERVELLERAEAAWRELEHGYQRRLQRAEEQEGDLLKQAQKLVEERKSYRNACGSLAQKLKRCVTNAEAERERLVALERQVYERACERHRLNEEIARSDAMLADYQCKMAQLERDLQFKEEQYRCKKMTQASELESVQALTHEAERVMHAELTSLKEHIAQASTEVLAMDARNKMLMEKVEDLKLEKNELLEGLETCQGKCENEVKVVFDTLKQKREEMCELKEKVLQCKCKLPVEVGVEARRSPSLAALCYCSPEDRFLESCSCTSLRSKLMNDLLADLFSGLQAELGNVSAEMPCQLLKCLEDKHSWDRANPVKTNIEKFFSKLLIGELDIAIATSIEKYHARWVGASCADACRICPNPCDEDEGWEQRAIEKRAQKLAPKLAEQLFQQRADQLTSKAKEIIKANPPCDCSGPSNAVYQCLNKPIALSSPYAAEKDVSIAAVSLTPATASLWRRTQQTVSNLKDQIDNLKMETLKKQDLRKMEQNILKVLQRTTAPEKDVEEHTAIEQRGGKKTVGSDAIMRGRNFGFSRSSTFKKKLLDNSAGTKKVNRNTSTLDPHIDKSKQNRPALYAINLCLCSTGKALTKPIQQSKSPVKKQSNSYAVPAFGSLKQIASLQDEPATRNSKTSVIHSCPVDCVCFHRTPSSSSIDKLLERLSKWKNELTNSSAEEDNMNPPQKEIIKKNSVTFYEAADVEGVKKCHVKTCKTKSNTPEVESPGPIATNSEYLATVNLDKSMDNMYCECKDSIDMIKNSQLNVEKNHNNSILGKSNTRILAKSKSKDSQLNDNKNCSELQPKQRESIDTKNSKLDIISNSHVMKRTSELSDVCDCEYNIKFLGVTITNDDEFHKSSTNNCTCRNHGNSCTKRSKPITGRCLLDDKQSGHPDRKTTTKSNVLVTQSFNVQVDSEPMNKTCTNSEVQNEDDYQDLEANAFELLHEHLTEKMNEYNKAFQYSSIPKEEQQKLCASILQKVQNVISESTNKMPDCQCPSAPDLLSLDGTWKRANSLLQEYLKTKLKRAQCICIPKKSHDDNMNILPVILEKISDLIDKDFKKLSQIYGFNKITSPKKEYNKIFDIPEKDTNTQCSSTVKCAVNTNTTYQNVSDFSQMNPENISRQISGNLIPLTEDISSQVPFLLGMESKYCSASCDAESKHIQSDIRSLNDCVCSCNFISENPSDINEHLKNESEYITNVKKREEPKFRKINIPYIGLTVECSCIGKLDACVCSKALLLESNKIDTMWSEVAKSKVNTNNLSYIMQRSLDPVLSDEILTKCLNTYQNADLRSTRGEQNNYCNTEISTCNEEDIVLKESSGNDLIDVKCDTTNTLLLDVYNEDIRARSTKNKNTDTTFYSQAIEQCKSDYFPKWESEHSLNVEKLFGRHCDCSMVPICHVKMLMESIENKLAHSKCTCDSLIANVCPVHSRFSN